MTRYRSHMSQAPQGFKKGADRATSQGKPPAHGTAPVPAMVCGFIGACLVALVYAAIGFGSSWAWGAAVVTTALGVSGAAYLWTKRGVRRHRFRETVGPSLVVGLLAAAACLSSCAVDAHERVAALKLTTPAAHRMKVEVTEAPRDLGDRFLIEVEVTPAPAQSLRPPKDHALAGGGSIDTVMFASPTHLPRDLDVGSSFTAWVRLKESPERGAEQVIADLQSGPLGGVEHSQAPTGWLRAHLSQLGQRWGGDAGALVPGLIVGDRSLQSAELSAVMVVSGLSHLTAVSGANVAALILVVCSVCRILNLNRLIQLVLITLTVLGFVSLVGPDPSVLRACLTGALGAFAVTVGRPGAALALLSLAATVLLVVDPWFIDSAAFQLSVLATFGILVGARPIAALLQTIKVPRLVAETTGVSAAATLVCMPALVALDSDQSMWIVPVNVLASPAAALVGLVAPAVIVLSWIPWPWGWPLAAGVGYPAEAIAGLASFSAQNSPSLTWPAGLTGILLASTLCVGLPVLGWCAWKHRAFLKVLWQRGTRRLNVSRATTSHKIRAKGTNAGLPDRSEGRLPRKRRGRRRSLYGLRIRLSGALAVIIVGALIGCATHWWSTSPGFAQEVRAGDVLFCDVGQGDGMVLVADNGRAIVIDAGEENQNIDECLTKAGIASMCGVVITHMHADHVGGLDGVLTGRTTDTLIYGTAGRDAPTADAQRAVKGDTIECAPWSVEVIWAPEHASSENGSSVVTRARVWNTTSANASMEVIGTGDLEEDQSLALLGTKELETEELEQPEASSQDADVPTSPVRVLKLAHHGSHTGGTQMIQEYQPDLGLIGVGAQNDYGHPHPDIVEALVRENVRVHRTDQEGDIILRPVSNGVQVLPDR